MLVTHTLWHELCYFWPPDPPVCKERTSLSDGCAWLSAAVPQRPTRTENKQGWKRLPGRWAQSVLSVTSLTRAGMLGVPTSLEAILWRMVAVSILRMASPGNSFHWAHRKSEGWASYTSGTHCPRIHFEFYQFTCMIRRVGGIWNYRGNLMGCLKTAQVTVLLKEGAACWSFPCPLPWTLISPFSEFWQYLLFTSLP